MTTNTLVKRKNNTLNSEQIITNLFNEIEQIIVNSRNEITYQINNTLVNTYFNIGKIIVENEQNGNIRAEYGKEVLLKLSKKLTNKYGTGFSRSNLQNMRLFYTRYENCQPLASKLSWSHYCYLIYIDDDRERKYKEKVLEMSKKGQIISTPTDILKEPYVFEFLGIKEEKPILESDLEKSLINHLSSFLMELGKGFMYVGNQMRITLDNNTHYYVDLVFYNKILRSYVLIDLKMTDMKPEYAGQMNMYINYYNKEIRDEFDNETIGIILCKGKKEVTMEYALGGLSNNIFTSSYTYYIPNKEQLINEVEKVLSENEK